VIRRADRQALLSQCALAWCGLASDRALEPRPARLALEFVVSERHDGIALRHDRWERRIALPRLTVAERERIFARALPVFAAFSAAERTHLAERYSLEVGEIARVALQDCATVAEARAACREASRGRLGELATLVDCPFTRDDLHVADGLRRVIDAFLFEARERPRFWEDEAARRLFPRGTGLAALMVGPPGTGKTMAAQVIAAELGLDLYRIDVATTVNKYIGETAKNLREIFNRAGEMNAVLFFDEADALFSKRTDVRDAHDRYANADTNYLLQLVEDYPGIALLATNKRQNMDEAFLRRLRYLMYFSRPDTRERGAIWRQLVASLAGAERAEALAGPLTTLADLVEVTGAEIKNATLAAVFLARHERTPLAARHLLDGLGRELGNQGRGLAVTLDDIERRRRP
jgi:SpoVK/Ycf46/Vps4 family AAA+-type ATPase